MSEFSSLLPENVFRPPLPQSPQNDCAAPVPRSRRKRRRYVLLRIVLSAVVSGSLLGAVLFALVPLGGTNEGAGVPSVAVDVELPPTMTVLLQAGVYSDASRRQGALATRLARGLGAYAFESEEQFRVFAGIASSVEDGFALKAVLPDELLVLKQLEWPARVTLHVAPEAETSAAPYVTRSLGLLSRWTAYSVDRLASANAKLPDEQQAYEEWAATTAKMESSCGGAASRLTDGMKDVKQLLQRITPSSAQKEIWNVQSALMSQTLNVYKLVLNDCQN